MVSCVVGGDDGDVGCWVSWGETRWGSCVGVGKRLVVMSDLLHGVVCHDVVDIFLYELVIGQLGVVWDGVVLMGRSGCCLG